MLGLGFRFLGLGFRVGLAVQNSVVGLRGAQL